VTTMHGMNYATGGLVPGWNVYVRPHLPQYWRSWWKDIKNTSPAGRRWALTTKTLDLAVRLHLVILEDGHLDLLALVLYLLGGVVSLFLALLRPTA